MAKKKATASPEDEQSGEVAKWVAEIELYEKESESWVGRSKKIVKRYKDEREPKSTKARYNILWSNIQTLHPALYASVPKPNIDRRFQDDDDIGRLSALVLERSVTYFVHTELFDSVMKQAVLDRLLGGRGTSWVRYVPDIREGDEITDDVPATVYSEEVLPDYIHWEDFGHTYGRTWEEITAVWKKAYLSRKQLVKRFGAKGKTVPLDHSPKKLNDTKIDDRLKKATVYEIWDKTDKKAIWIHKDVKTPLDEKPDPLKLKDFFPCPKPLFATLANDSVIPVPDYVQYQDQAQELDDLTGRIRSITKSLKVAGVYDASAEGLQRLLSEGVENQLIPVQQWAVFGEKGGLQGVIAFLPIKEIAEVLVGLHDSREKVKAVIYEITGISDIIRGASDPNETLGAQELKGKYAGLRLDDKQKDVARFGCDLVRLMTEIIAEHFSMDTIKQVSGVKLLTEQEKQQAQMPGPDGQPAQLPEEIQELMKLPSWEQIEKLIRNDAARCFRIDIETDSTIKIDQEADKASRVELLTAVGGFLQQAAAVPIPELQPLLMEMLMFGMKGFKVGRELETTFKTAMDKIRKKAEAPQQVPPDPAMITATSKAETDKGRLQLDTEVAKAELTLKAEELQHKKLVDVEGINLEGSKHQVETQAKQAEINMKGNEMQAQDRQFGATHELEQQKAKSADTKARMDAKIKADPDVAMTDTDMNGGEAPIQTMMTQFAEGLMQALRQIAQAQEAGTQQILKAVTAEREVTAHRDAQGRMVKATSRVAQ